MSNAFRITLQPQAVPSADVAMATGVLQFDDVSEGFEADLSYWSAERYRASWHAAASALVEGRDRAAFVTSITDPDTANFIFLWAAYRDGDEVHLQQQVLFLEDLDVPLELDDVGVHVRERELTDEEGNEISEWTIDIDQVRGFRDSLERERRSA